MHNVVAAKKFEKKNCFKVNEVNQNAVVTANETPNFETNNYNSIRSKYTNRM